MTRKAKTSPSFEHYVAASNQLDAVLVSVLKGHLVVEALLVEIIQLKVSGDSPWKWTFLSKTKRCVELGFLSDKHASALNNLNDLRNDFAHVLGQDVTFDRVFELITLTAAAGFDFSDDTIHRDRQLSEEYYGIESGLMEVLNSFYFDLAQTLLTNGGPDRLAG